MAIVQQAAAQLEIARLSGLHHGGSISPFSVKKQVLYNGATRLTYGVYCHDPSRKSPAR
jgi:hypothetical protein